MSQIEAFVNEVLVNIGVANIENGDWTFNSK